MRNSFEHMFHKQDKLNFLIRDKNREQLLSFYMEIQESLENFFSEAEFKMSVIIQTDLSGVMPSAP